MGRLSQRSALLVAALSASGPLYATENYDGLAEGLILWAVWIASVVLVVAVALVFAIVKRNGRILWYPAIYVGAMVALCTSLFWFSSFLTRLLPTNPWLLLMVAFPVLASLAAWRFGRRLSCPGQQ
ncbi:hypothetical protein PAGU2595_026610 [Lysobacter xanthus]